MTFANQKKTYLAKLDQSRKGSIDTKVIPLLESINRLDNYYTTSSCSGRVCLWSGSGRKNETNWLKVSHDSVTEDFFRLEMEKEREHSLVWLRFEPFILHVACKDLNSANRLLEKAKSIYKKSCLLSVSNKIIVEVRGSEFIEMPWCQDGKLLFSGDGKWLASLINGKFEIVWKKMEKFNGDMSKLYLNKTIIRP